MNAPVITDRLPTGMMSSTAGASIAKMEALLSLHVLLVGPALKGSDIDVLLRDTAETMRAMLPFIFEAQQ